MFGSLRLSVVVAAEALVEIAAEVLVAAEAVAEVVAEAVAEVVAVVLAVVLAVVEAMDADRKNSYIIGAQSLVESICALLLR